MIQEMKIYKKDLNREETFPFHPFYRTIQPRIQPGLFFCGIVGAWYGTVTVHGMGQQQCMERNSYRPRQDV